MNNHPSHWRPVSLRQFYRIIAATKTRTDAFGFTVIDCRGQSRRIARQDLDGTMYIDPAIYDTFLS